MINFNSAIDFLYSYNAVRMNLAVGNPRQHGNGFFQLDLYNGYRLHVWDPDYPLPQKVPTPIHDHRFSFTSLVLYGTQQHVTYDIKTNMDLIRATHHIYQARPRYIEDTVLEPTEKFVSVGEKHIREIKKGNTYYFDSKLFHETPNDSYVVTLLKKYDVDYSHNARVLCPIGYEPDNDFTRYDLDVNEQWKIIEKAVSKVLEI